MSFNTSLRSAFAELEIPLPQEAESAFEKYWELLLERNSHVNLTAITDPDEAAVRHFADSASMLRYADLPRSASLIDVGTGAGFPSLPAAVLRRDLRVTLLDSLRKRLDFLKDVTQELGIDAPLVHERAEDAGHNPALRERFDVACARAVASLPVLCEYCLPLVRTGGCFVALKGAAANEELSESSHALEVLGGKIERSEYFELNGMKRCVITVRKISHTPTQYPRCPAKIGKSRL